MYIYIYTLSNVGYSGISEIALRDSLIYTPPKRPTPIFFDTPISPLDPICWDPGGNFGWARGMELLSGAQGSGATEQIFWAKGHTLHRSKMRLNAFPAVSALYCVHSRNILLALAWSWGVLVTPRMYATSGS